MKSLPWVLVASLAILATGGCATTSRPAASAHDTLDAVLWLQASAEYAATTAGIYAAATAALEAHTSAADSRTGQWAVVMDLDETVLDNSRYQAQLVADEARYASDTWDDWVELKVATAVPGAVEFIRASQAMGVHVAFVTNRPCRPRSGTADPCPQKADTLANLQRIGINTDSTTLFLRGERPPSSCSAVLSNVETASGGWSSDKTSRRDCVALTRDIALLFGDQFGDFYEVPDASRIEDGRNLARTYQQHWGTTWFMLPNPTYGGWRPPATLQKRRRLQGYK